MLVARRSSQRRKFSRPQDDSSELLEAQPLKAGLPSQAATPTPGLRLKKVGSRKKLGVVIEVVTPSPPSPFWMRRLLGSLVISTKYPIAWGRCLILPKDLSKTYSEQELRWKPLRWKPLKN
ncbi:hypothetical protein AMTR_s00004p00269330 [Amborella trichopoda]|uniref:Uncharacterized protein n=1 Tax=Amborella trichopoda TaxID=13333 RepID=W1NEF4_AMBTC|nr:hypothetical protein AMTR_s00004p00269330 [Amborella trichopoda]